MNAKNVCAVILIACGVLALVYGGFSYTKESHEAKFGPLRLAVEEKREITVPVWAGVGAIAAGVVLLLVGRK